MNPLLFKAHALQWLTVDLIAHPADHPLRDYTFLILLYLALNAPWAMLLRWAIQQATGARVPYIRAYGLALPPLLLYVPILLTLCSDVLTQSFQLADRFILLFTLFIAVQMVGALFGASLKEPRGRQAIGLREGLTLSLLLLLLALPYSFALLGLNAALHII